MSRILSQLASGAVLEGVTFSGLAVCDFKEIGTALAAMSSLAFCNLPVAGDMKTFVETLKSLTSAPLQVIVKPEMSSDIGDFEDLGHVLSKLQGYDGLLTSEGRHKILPTTVVQSVRKRGLEVLALQEAKCATPKTEAAIPFIYSDETYWGELSNRSDNTEKARPSS